MTPPSRLVPRAQNPVSVAVLAVAVLAVVLSITGGAVAAAKIGRNLVVTSSIKHGAVTGAKVRDGSLTAADLAPGVLPASASDKQVMMASCECVPSGVFAEAILVPSGFTPVGTSADGLLPVAVRLADFRVQGQTQVGTASATVFVCHTAPGVGGGDCVDVCKLTGGASTCASSGHVDAVAGGELSLGVRAGPDGSYPGYLEIGYTLQVLP